MEKEPFFRPVKKPGLWGHEWCDEVKMEDATILCCVVTTEEAAAGSGFETVSRKLKETLHEDMEKRAESEIRNVKAKWLDALEDWALRPLESRRASVLKRLHYVPVGPEHWRRTLDRL